MRGRAERKSGLTISGSSDFVHSPLDRSQTKAAVYTEASARQAVFAWLDHVVIGQNFCPFARMARQRDRICMPVCSSGDPGKTLQVLSDAATALLAGHADDTVLLLLPDAYADFDDFLDLVSLADALLIDLGFDGQLQLASFHPHYQFADIEPEHVGNWTNRSPVPILHLLQEASLAQNIQRYPDTDMIPVRNIAQLEAMDSRDLDELKQICLALD